METTALFQDIPVNTIMAFLRFSAIATAVYLVIKAFKWANKYAIYRVKPFNGQISFELKSTLVICLFDAVVLTSAGYFGLFPNGTPTIQNHILTFVCMFVWFEFSLYFMHRLLHTKYFYWIHEHHHKSAVTTPFTAISSSLLDRTIGIVVPFLPVVLLDQFAGIHATQIGLASYVLLLMLINIYTHINVEIIPTWMVKNKFLGKILITPSFHSLHHARHRGNYGITTPLMDMLFETCFPDYEKVHESSRAGVGLKSLGQRLGARRRKAKSAQPVSAPTAASTPNATPAPVPAMASNKRESPVLQPVRVASR